MGADVFKDGIPSQDDYGPIADRSGQLSPPDLATLHASSVSHLETGRKFTKQFRLGLGYLVRVDVRDSGSF